MCMLLMKHSTFLHSLRNPRCVNFFRFVVRDFVYNEEELAAGKNEITKLEHDKKKQYASSAALISCQPFFATIMPSAHFDLTLQSFNFAIK